jgi:hypothetical protein
MQVTIIELALRWNQNLFFKEAGVPIDPSGGAHGPGVELESL